MCFHFPLTRLLLLFRILHMCTHLFTINLLLRALHSALPRNVSVELWHILMFHCTSWAINYHCTLRYIPLFCTTGHTVVHPVVQCTAVHCANFESSLLIGELPLSVSRIPKQKSKVSSSPSGRSLSSRMDTKLNFGIAKKEACKDLRMQGKVCSKTNYNQLFR